VCAIGAVTAQAQNPPPPAGISAVPRSVPFSGQAVLDSGERRTGTALLTFSLYADQEGGAPLWVEQQLVTFDSDGRYSVILGSTLAGGLPADAFAAATPKWLGVRIEGESEQPRLMLLSVPYALKASDADTIGGKSPTELLPPSRLADSIKKAIADSVRPFALKESAGGPAATTVTQNALVKYLNAGGATTESSAVDVGGKLGIAVGTPLTELDVAGGGSSTTITLRNGGSAADVLKLVGSDGSLRIGSATTANLISLVGGKVGINTTTPAEALEVRGNIRIPTGYLIGEGALVQGVVASPGGVSATAYQAGSAAVTADGPTGVKGISHGSASDEFGVWGASYSATGTAIYGEGPSSGLAGRFDGKVQVYGPLNATGKVGIGTNTPSARLEVEDNTLDSIYAHNYGGYALHARSEQSYAGYFEGYVYFSNLIFLPTLGGAGNVPLCRNASNQVSTCSSSLRYKHDVRPFSGGFDIVERLQPIRFDWNNGGMPDIGFAAEDVSNVDPLLVFHNDDGAVEGVKYNQLSAVFVNALKQQHAEIARQQELLESQQRQIDALRRLVCGAHSDAPGCAPQ
jgi:hypothetical protein